MPDYGEDFLAKCYIEISKDYPEGKFQTGMTVRYISLRFLRHTTLRHFIGCDFKILASRMIDEEHTEYLLEGFPFFVWENELMSILGQVKSEPSLN
jgi:hypothetical protein